MENLTELELNMIIESLKTEQRELHRTMQDLERRNMHDGNQNVRIQTRMHDLNDLIRKLDDKNIFIESV